MTVNEVTPTTDQVRFAAETSTFPESALTDGAFDRWLTAHNRKIAAEALREAADELDKALGTHGPGNRNTDYGRAALDLLAWLRDRADRIEQGGES